MDYVEGRGADAPADEVVVSLAEARGAAARKLNERADKARQKAEQAEREAREREELERAVRESTTAFVEQRDVHYVEQTNYWWFRDRDSGEWTPHRRDALLNINTDLIERAWFLALQEHLREQGRWHRKITATFRPVGPGVLNTLSADFCREAEGEPHPAFDLLALNLAGGDADAQEHIERLVLAKWLHPDNPTLPYLCLHDTGGGSGKSLFVSTVLSAAFGAKLVADNVSMDDLTGKFNAHLAGKAVVFLNESVEDKVDDNRLKMIAGSRSIWVETKGIQRYEVDNTAWCIVAGNSPMGSVRVSNSSVDRRYSIVRTGGALVERVRRAFGLADNEAARRWIARDGVSILGDRGEVGRWLRTLRERHGDVRDVPAFHGRDYDALVKAQRPFHELVFDAVFRAEGFEYIRKPLLYKLYVDLCRQHNNGYGLVRNRALYAHLQVWAEREGVALLERNAKWTTRTFGGDPRRTSADVIYAAGGAAYSGELRDNDCRYGIGVCGRWEWSVEP